MQFRRLILSVTWALVMSCSASAVIVETDTVNHFFDGPVTNTSDVFHDNAVRRISYMENMAQHGGGGGIVIPVSNGENGMDVGAGPGQFGGPNTDEVNEAGVGAAIDLVNGGDGTMGNRLTNGNTFRFSVWMQQDPENPIMAEPSVEPVLKFEIWSEAQSTYGDYDGRQPFAQHGDRLWDTDLNATSVFYEGTQSVASYVDISGNGTVVTGDEPVASLPQASGVEWVLVESSLVIDDDPGGNGNGWLIAGESFYVDAIEEVRATLFTGDFSGDSSFLADGGSFFVDNVMLEVFADEATMLATPNPNPMPSAALIGDYNGNGTVDAADYTVWRDNLNMSAAPLQNRDPNVTGLVKLADYDAWKSNFGNTAGGGSVTMLAYGPAAVPEPAAWMLAVAAGAGLAIARGRR